MNEMLNKKDVLDAIYAKMEKTDKPDVILGLAAAMSTVKQMQAAPVNPAEQQKPCEDAISRQAVLMEIDKYLCGVPFEEKGIDKVIKDLPLVTPAEKVGHWIKIDDCSNSGYYCSECRKRVVKEGWSDTVKIIKYCPNCGSYNGGVKNVNDK